MTISNKKKRIYLDTCIFSGLLDESTKEDDITAINNLIFKENVILVTSPKTLEEFNRTPDPIRKRNLLTYYRLIEKVQNIRHFKYVPGLFGAVMFNEAPFNGGVYRSNSTFQSLKKIFDKNDTEHIFNAFKNKCDYFVTIDYKTILKKLKNNRQIIDKLLPGFMIIHPTEISDV